MAKRSRSQARRRRQRKTKGWARQREQQRVRVQVRHQRRRAARRQQRSVVTLPTVGAPGASQGLAFFLQTLNIPLISPQIQTLAAAVG